MYVSFGSQSLLVEIRLLAVEGEDVPADRLHSFPYAGINRIRFEGIVSVK